MLKLSIAIATYNGERYLHKQLGSLLWQTRPADEVIIFDDCSTDQTKTVVTDFISQHKLEETWHFSVNPENLGYVKNFAKALSATTGDVIFLCDQDDIWLPEKLSEMTALFEKYPKITTINTPYLMIDEADVVIDSDRNRRAVRQSKGKLKKCSKKSLITRNVSLGCTMGFRREMKELYLKNSDFSYFHDYNINLLAMIHSEVYLYEKILIKYRIHSNNTEGKDPSGAFNPQVPLETKLAKTRLQLDRADQKRKVLVEDSQATAFLDRVISFHEKRIALLEQKTKKSWRIGFASALKLKDIRYMKFLLEDYAVLRKNWKG